MSYTPEKEESRNKVALRLPLLQDSKCEYSNSEFLDKGIRHFLECIDLSDKDKPFFVGLSNFLSTSPGLNIVGRIIYLYVVMPQCYSIYIRPSKYISNFSGDKETSFNYLREMVTESDFFVENNRCRGVIIECLTQAFLEHDIVSYCIRQFYDRLYDCKLLFDVLFQNFKLGSKSIKYYFLKLCSLNDTDSEISRINKYFNGQIEWIINCYMMHRGNEQIQNKLLIYLFELSKKLNLTRTYKSMDEAVSVTTKLIKMIDIMYNNLLNHLVTIDFGEKTGENIFIDNEDELIKLFISINSETLPLFTGKVVESLGFSEPSEEYIRYVENSSFLLLNKYKEKYGDIFASTKKIICVRKSNNKSNIDFNNPLSVHINYYIVEQTNEYNEKDHILDIIYGEITGLDINKYLLSRINNHDDFNDLHEDFEGYDGVKWLIDNEYVYREIFELFDYVLDFD